jgi:hypothetical protein
MAGNAYIVGQTDSTDFPITNAIQPTIHGPTDSFVSKINADGTALVYSTYLGGSGGEEALGIAVDATGNAYIAGMTFSTDFPTANAIQPSYGGSLQDGFVTKINAAGDALVYSTYLGGTNGDQANGIAVDASGNAYVTGSTASPDFPTTDAIQPTNEGWDAFVTKISANGANLLYSTYLGGSNGDYGTGIALDSADEAYVAGYTYSTDFPTANAVQPTNHGCPRNFPSCDAFVTKISADGTGLVYSTYLGGTADDAAYGIAVDIHGNAYVTGETSSIDFPFANAIKTHEV